ncbi:ABC transporter permease [Plantactinospora sp. CA-290183]|uniref:ABC transporter permease n=1 Tax=Plantactinospora sp. CA-290183 TaxID=3240006 RepID=UPI003D8F1F63
MNTTISPGAGPAVVAGAPRRVVARSTVKLVVTEAKLFVREPVSAFFSVLFPVILILVLGAAIPSFTEPSPDIGGRLPIEFYLPVTLALAIATVALVGLLSTLTAYREKGVLRRLSTTPVSPIRLLAAQLVVNLAALVVGCGLTVLGTWLAFGLAVRPNVAGLLLAFLLGSTAMVAVALLIAAVSPTSRTSMAIGSLVYYPLLFAAGVWTPGPLMPDAVRRVADFTPLGAASQALQDAWAGDWPRPLHLAVLAGFTALLGGLAARLFRWT